jgi:SAM-dependent methyltransferase
MLRSIIRSQVYLSRRFDALLPSRFTVDGNREFFTIAPEMLKPGMTVWDIGGGKQPLISRALKEKLGLRIVGFDISGDELAAAPAGVYDRTVVADLCNFRGAGDADLVICQAVLEHVPDAASAFQGISSILKPGAIAILFTPSRNAAFARLNLLLPQKLKERLLFAFYPEAAGHQGFPAYYDRCTPRQFRRIAQAAGLRIAEQRLYYQSAYFTFAFPVHLLWRLWVLLFAAVAPESAVETFTLTLVKM